jgi:hypothetical protein
MDKSKEFRNKNAKTHANKKIPLRMPITNKKFKSDAVRCLRIFQIFRWDYWDSGIMIPQCMPAEMLWLKCEVLYAASCVLKSDLWNRLFRLDDVDTLHTLTLRASPCR